MATVETMLTPELAAQLLASPHERQRRRSKQTVTEYVRRIKGGRWRLTPDPIMVAGKKGMFNGGHRCEAVVVAHRSIPVLIDWDADETLFDVIDVGRYRSAYQFVDAKDASTRASAARIILWYEQRFDRSLGGVNLVFDNTEILHEVARHEQAFDVVMTPARAVYEYTSIGRAVATAAFALAEEMGYREEIEAFVNGVRDPGSVPEGSPARLLADRFRQQNHRGRRRQMVDDWTILVRAFNMHLEGTTTGALMLSRTWPRIAETSAEHRRRAGNESSRRNKRNAA